MYVLNDGFGDNFGTFDEFFEFLLGDWHLIDFSSVDNDWSGTLLLKNGANVDGDGTSSNNNYFLALEVLVINKDLLWVKDEVLDTLKFLWESVNGLTISDDYVVILWSEIFSVNLLIKVNINFYILCMAVLKAEIYICVHDSSWETVSWDHGHLSAYDGGGFEDINGVTLLG